MKEFDIASYFLLLYLFHCIVDISEVEANILNSRSLHSKFDEHDYWVEFRLNLGHM